MRGANFIQESAASIAGTNGDGAVSLAQIAGWPRFSHAVPDGSVVRYVIEDTVGKRGETGIGQVSGNVLTRSRVLTTWDGSTYDDTAPAPLAFGSNPTAGSVVISLAPTAEVQAPIIPAMQSLLTTNADPTWNQFPLSAHLGAWNGTGSSNSVNSAIEYYSYYKLDTAGRLQGLQLEATGTGGPLKLALYQLGADGLPAKKILDFAVMDTSSSGVKTQADPSLWTPAGAPFLLPGWYAIGMIASVSVTVRGLLNAAANVQGQTPLGRTATYAGYKNMIQITGKSYANGLPDVPDFTGATINTANFLWLGLKVQP